MFTNDVFLDEIKSQMKQYFIEFLDKYINNQNTIKKQASKINATKDQLILEFEKYIQTYL